MRCDWRQVRLLRLMPEPLRIDGGVVAAFLERNFPDEPLQLAPRRMRVIINDLLSRGISGGAVYDGLIALTAGEHGAELLTLDRRADRPTAAAG
jgi:hypothetical protein